MESVGNMADPVSTTTKIGPITQALHGVLKGEIPECDRV